MRFSKKSLLSLIVTLACIAAVGGLLVPRSARAYSQSSITVGPPIARLQGVAYDGTHLWMASGDPNIGNPSEHKVYKVDPTTRAVVATVDFSDQSFRPHSVLYDGRYVWVEGSPGGGASPNNNRVGRIDPIDDSRIYIQMNAPTDCRGSSRLGYDGTHLWSYNYQTGEICRYNIAANTTSKALLAAPDLNWTKQGMAFDGTNMWVAVASTRTLYRLQATNPPQWLSSDLGFAPGYPTGVVFDGQHIYALDSGSIRKYLPDGTRVATMVIPEGNQAYDLTYAEGYLWVSHSAGLLRVRTSDGMVLPGRAQLGSSNASLVSFGSEVWAVFVGNPGEDNATQYNFSLAISSPPPFHQNVLEASATIGWLTTDLGDSQVYYSDGGRSWQTIGSFPQGTQRVRNPSWADIWLAGSDGKTHRSFTRGGSWMTRQSFTQNIRGFDAQSGAVAIGTPEDRIVQTASSGVQWSQGETLPETGISVDYASAASAWVVGTGGEIRHTENGGKTWIQQTTAPPFTGTLNGVAAFNENTAWIVGQGERIFSTTDGGGTWQERHSGPNDLREVMPFSQTGAWTVGVNGTVLRTTNGGANWDRFTTNPPSHLYGLVALDATNAWVGGSNNTILHTDNGGSTWTATPSPAPPTATIIDFSSNGPNMLAATASGLVMRYDLVTPISRLQPAQVTTHTVTLNTLQPGTTYTYYVCSRNDFDVTICSDVQQFTTTSPDIIPPTITFTQPNGNPAYVNTPSVTVGGSYQDTVPGSVQRVEVQLNANPVQQATGTPPFPDSGPGTWTLANVGPLNPFPALNTALARAVDGGNNEDTETKTIIYDNVAPTVQITTTNQTVANPAFTVNGTASDNDQVASVQVIVNGNPQGNATGPPFQTGNWNRTVTLSAGQNTIRATAYDRATNSTQSNQITVTLDNTAPQAAITSHTFGQTVVTPTINLAGTASDNIQVARVEITVNGVPLGNAAGPPFPSGNWTFPNVALTPGPNTIRAQAFDNADNPSALTNVNNIQVIYVVPDFTVSVNPSSQTIQAGQNAQYTVTVTAIGGFNQAVTLSLAGSVPPGASGSFNPQIIPMPAGGNAQLTITTQVTTPQGSYALIARGTASGGTVREGNFTLNINPAPDFTIMANPSSQTVEAGNQTSYVITLTAQFGYNEPVDLSAAGLPAQGVSAAFLPPTVTPTPGGVQSTFTVTTQPTALPGTYTLTITGQGLSRTHTTTVDLIIGPDVTPPTMTPVVCTTTHDSMTLAWDTSEPTNAVVEWDTDDPNPPYAGAQQNFTYETQHVETVSGLQELTLYYWRVTSCDQANPIPNCVSQLGQCQTLLAPDTIPPTIVIFNPTGGQEINGIRPFEAHASDNRGVQTVDFFLNPGNVHLGQDTTGIPDNLNGDFAVTWDTNLVANGNYTLTARAFDGTFQVDSAPVAIEIDNSPLLITYGPFADPVTNTDAYIKWGTDRQADSLVEYGRETAPGVYNYTNQQYLPALETDHEVYLPNLVPNSIYHYHITSCDDGLPQQCAS